MLVAVGDVRALYATEIIQVAFAAVLVLVYGPALTRQQRVPTPIFARPGQ